MPPVHTLFCTASSGFIIGTIAGGLGFPPTSAALLLIIAICVLLILRIPTILILLSALFFLAGNIYFAVDDHAYMAARQAATEVDSVTGRVIDVPRSRGTDQITTITSEDGTFRLYVHTTAHPQLSYGDIIRVSGSVVTPPPDSYGQYMAKERVHGTLFHPDLKIIGKEGHLLLDPLYRVREYIKEAVAYLFTQKQAAFLGGVLLGDRDEFTNDFLDKLSVSGTIHLTALSGLHMAIIVFLTITLFGALFGERSRLAFLASFAAVALFVTMTGFKVSAVRASLMAFLVGLAKRSDRVYNPQNAILFAALCITVWNPKAPVFDLAFQLSFAATISIIYLTPVIQRLPFFAIPGTLAWRNILAITAAAQLGVAPIIIAHFATFSLTALAANVAILIVIPFIMTLGFMTIIISLFSTYGALLAAKPTAFLIDYVIGVIETFSILRIMFNPEIGVGVALAYYALLLALWWHWSPPVRE